MNNRVHRNKLIIRSILVVFIITFLTLHFKLFKREKCENVTKEIYQTVTNIETGAQLPRESITFILGEDREADNPYYAEAINYYLHNEEGRTEYMVTICRSLLEVRDYLTNNPPANKQPWGLVNLVSHGNQWLGLSARVAPEAKRASTANIEEYISSGQFPEVPDSLFDNNTELYIHGCGIGKNKELVNAIQLAFGGANETPVTYASELYTYYTSKKYNGAVLESNRYQAETWSVNYKMGYKPEIGVLSKQLSQLYPESDINWTEALNREQPRWDGDVYHYTFEVPVKWVIPFESKDSMPDVTTMQKQVDWIKKQENITCMLDKIDIPVEKFNWWFRTVYVNNEDGTRSPALWIKGYSTILVVIKPMVEDADNSNLVAEL